MNNNYNQMGPMPNQNVNFNNQPMNNAMPNQNMAQPQPNNGMMNQQPMPQPMNNQQPGNPNQSFGYNYQPAPKFKFPPIAKDLVSIIGYVSAIVMAIGSFLNFATLKVYVEGYESYSSTQTVNYFITDGTLKDGVFIFVLALIALTLVHFRKNLFALIPAGISAIILAIDISGAQELVEEYQASSYWLTYKADISYGPAVFIIAIGVIGIIAHAVMYYLNKNKAKQVNNPMYGPQPMNNGMMNQPMPNNGMMNQQPMPQPMQQPMNNMPNQQMPYPQSNQYPNNMM